MKQRKCRRMIAILCLISCLSAVMLTSCKNATAEFKAGQVLRVGSSYVTKEHAAVLLCGLQKKYENMFGTEAWSKNFGDSTLDQYIKEQVKNQLVQIASMNLLAKEKNVSLSKAEKEKAKQAANAFVSCFSKEQMKAAGFDKEDVQELYEQYAMAEKVYEHITEKVNKEISDDQARMIDVQVIFFRTVQESDGNETDSASPEAVNTVTEKAYQVWERANAGESFESLAAEFNEGQQLEYHIGRGEMESKFEEAAFQLTNGQISGLVDGEEGIYIIKCISNYNQTETDANKTAIYKENCSKVFNEEYDKFMKNVKVKLNESAWEKVTIILDVVLPDADFLQIYNTTEE